MVQIMTYEPNVYDKNLPLVIEIISALGSIITLLLYIGGISAILLLQDWVRTQQRVVLLQAETARQEYAYLRKQINPHFLFNVLNNIGIIAYDDADLSVSLMNSLKTVSYTHLVSLLRSSGCCGFCSPHTRVARVGVGQDGTPEVFASRATSFSGMVRGTLCRVHSGVQVSGHRSPAAPCTRLTVSIAFQAVMSASVEMILCKQSG